jgi:hypothetical protein
MPYVGPNAMFLPMILQKGVISKPKEQPQLSASLFHMVGSLNSMAND